MTTDSADTLARTIWGEARGEGDKGMQAVANVVMNRVAQPKWWGKDVISVCTKPWQFSCWNKGDPNREKLIGVTEDDPQFKIASGIAKLAVNGDLPDVTNGATSYYDARMATPPQWSNNKTPCAIIGHHVFFDDI
jgi:N-acetylmuramoyl-L-alanine amidase